MKIGTRVAWTLSNKDVGMGRVIGPGIDDRHVLVAVDPPDSAIDAKTGRAYAAHTLETHPVIHCATSWLRIVL